jgi:DTW domain-containing protein YfiP
MLASVHPYPSDNLPHRTNCYRCFKPEVVCICDTIERVANRTGIVILQHPRERFHPIGTVRIARLALANVRVEPCAPWLDSSAIQARLPRHTSLLYPAPGARNLATLSVNERPRHLALLDGTWFHTKKIYDAHGWLRQLPHVSLTPSEPSRYRLRREPKERYVATIEAIVYALRLLEPQTPGIDGLLRSFARMIDRQTAWAPLPQ